ncbi:hypothetical protein [Planctomyces sp. SH-PL14]|uniref:hypothetical protein n=1 Tax=Planctomyces sp. SH-PL14 TaxID=1632864 RepID=UPI00078DC2E6|nr:hypothetical protein [Planctomyces sp. SH-PL14]AMV20067.1 hypothetical protein VT03_19385 [Planctomyces sp. SH-PL14]
MSFNRTGLAMLLLLVTAVGCGGATSERTNVKGKVTIGGKPVVYGTIDFSPDSSKGHKGPAGTAEIVDGAYDTAASGGGIFPGPHIVVVTGFDARPSSNTNETVASTVKPLFTGYRVATDISSGTYDLDVSGDAAGKDFSQPSGGQTRRGNDP